MVLIGIGYQNMNKYIKTDIENGYKYLKSGIINALNDIISGEESKIELGYRVPLEFIEDCMMELDMTVTDKSSNWIEGVFYTLDNQKIIIFATRNTLHRA